MFLLHDFLTAYILVTIPTLSANHIQLAHCSDGMQVKRRSCGGMSVDLQEQRTKSAMEYPKYSRQKIQSLKVMVEQ